MLQDLTSGKGAPKVVEGRLKSKKKDKGDKDGLVSKKEQKMLQDLISSIGGTGPKKDDAASFLRFVDNEKKPSASEFINFVDKQVRCARIPTRAPCLARLQRHLPIASAAH